MVLVIVRVAEEGRPAAAAFMACSAGVCKPQVATSVDRYTPRWYSRLTSVREGNWSITCCALCCIRLSTARPSTQAIPGYDSTMRPPMASRIFVALFTPRLPQGVAACREDTTDSRRRRHPQHVT